MLSTFGGLLVIENINPEADLVVSLRDPRAVGAAVSKGHLPRDLGVDAAAAR